MIKIQVPARICFFGDHQDYLGLPVIAGTIDRYIRLKATPITGSNFQLFLADLGTHRTIPLNTNPEKIEQSDFMSAALAIGTRNGMEWQQGYKIEITGDIPINAGLSSSSALTVAWIRFLIEAQHGNRSYTDAQIGHWAYEAEVLFFKSPGGLMDQYTIAQQGVLYIETDKGITRRLNGSFGTLVVAESGISKKTLEVLKNARAYQEGAISEIKRSHPHFKIQEIASEDYDRYKPLVSERYHNHWYAAAYNYGITMAAKQLLQSESPDIDQIGRLMNEHQEILERCIKNTPDSMILMMQKAREAGALGTKIVGSGGGGCMVAMTTPMQAKNVINAFLEAGAKDAYVVELTFPSNAES